MSNETFGMILFLVVEVMFFAALVNAYLVLRVGADQWRPPNLPSLVSTLSVSNTVVLCVSGVSILLAIFSVRRDDPRGLGLYLWITIALGITFLGLQGFDFYRLFHRYQIPLAGNVFGSVFYTLLGLHGIHVLGGVIFLGYVLANHRKYHRYRAHGVLASTMYWYFVIAVWIFLFFALYVY
jgi:heme/copper-type cytochrome/quinol oxidase subunit 3